jgi:opacity protein-like surface antigen
VTRGKINLSQLTAFSEFFLLYKFIISIYYVGNNYFQGGGAMKVLQWKRVLLLLLLFMVLLALPGLARGEMYIEAYLGGAQGANAGMNATNNHPGGLFQTVEQHEIPGKLNPAVIGGLKIGTWFVKEGFLGMNYPDWMKYLGFYLDFSYHRLDFRNQAGKTVAYDNFLNIPRGSTTITNLFFSEGTAATLAFMFAGRYGFLPDSDVPFGRLQPYLGVGPAILFTTQQPRIGSSSIWIFGGPATFPYNIKTSSDSSVNLALAVDAGIRYMCLKNVSLDLSFKYRFSRANYSYNYTDPLDGTNQGFSLHPTYHLLSGQVGAAYHF